MKSAKGYRTIFKCFVVFEVHIFRFP